jgi:hypothetical protein
MPTQDIDRAWMRRVDYVKVAAARVIEGTRNGLSSQVSLDVLTALHNLDEAIDELNFEERSLRNGRAVSTVGASDA